MQRGGCPRDPSIGAAAAAPLPLMEEWRQEQRAAAQHLMPHGFPQLGDGPSLCLQGLTSVSCTHESAAARGRAEEASAQHSLLLAGPPRQPKLRALHLLFCRIFIFPVLPGTKTHQKNVQ